MEGHTQTQNVSDSGFTAETVLNQEEDPRILASSYMMYKIGKFSFIVGEIANFQFLKCEEEGHLFCSYGLKLTKMQIKIIESLIQYVILYLVLTPCIKVMV